MTLELNKIYQDSEGNKVRIVWTDVVGPFPVLGLISINGGEVPVLYTADGVGLAVKDIISPWVEQLNWNWSIIPPWFYWVTIDYNEHGIAWSTEPTLSDFAEGCWTSGEGRSLYIPKEFTPVIPPGYNWKLSKTRRPPA